MKLCLCLSVCLYRATAAASAAVGNRRVKWPRTSHTHTYKKSKQETDNCLLFLLLDVFPSRK